MSILSGPSLAVIEEVCHHPAAARLDIVTILGTPAIVGRDEYKAGELCVFIPFDSVIPSEADWAPEPVRGRRVKAMRLRGIFSMALAIKNQWGFTEDDDIAEKLGITKWEPPVEYEACSMGKVRQVDVPPPGIIVSHYDIDSMRTYHRSIELGENVEIREKIHGTNARYVFTDGKLWAGSRNRWLSPETDNVWWRTASQYGLEDLLRNIPDIVLFGEIYGGKIQGGFPYDAPVGETKFAMFDMWDNARGKFLEPDTNLEALPKAPLLYKGPYQGFDAHKPLAEGQSTLGGNIREGFVIRTDPLRYDVRLGRIVLKLHGEGYLLKKK